MRFLEELAVRLQTIPIRHYRDIEGWLTPKEAVALYRLSRSCRSGARVVEIGSWKGKSTYCIARGLRDGLIVAIDPFDAAGETGHRYDAFKGGTPLLDQFRTNLGRHGLLDKVAIKIGPSSRFASDVSDVDLLFIDGDHSIAGCEYRLQDLWAEGECRRHPGLP